MEYWSCFSFLPFSALAHDSTPLFSIITVVLGKSSYSNASELEVPSSLSHSNPFYADKMLI